MRTLDKIVEGLPRTHRARKELDELRKNEKFVTDGQIEFEARAERIRAASMFMAAVIATHLYNPKVIKDVVVKQAVEYADALLERIDIT